MPSSHSVEVQGLDEYEEAGYPALAIAAIGAVLDAYAESPSEVGVELVPSAVIQRLNRDYRGVDSVTDVLSFPMGAGEPLAVPAGFPTYLGDIAICVDRALEQARDYGHAPERELAYLAVHGALHLIGFDHERDEDTRLMREAEERIMAMIGQPEPHAGG